MNKNRFILQFLFLVVQCCKRKQVAKELSGLTRKFKMLPKQRILTKLDLETSPFCTQQRQQKRPRLSHGRTLG
uniref:Secreted protein n=1 Tax=Octopus bimaculoides TaxID=37653 RepID=A0A0L8H8I6_OCTBM